MISRKTEAQMTNLHRRDYESTTYPISLTNDNLQMIIKIIEDSITELTFRISLFTFNEDKYRIT